MINKCYFFFFIGAKHGAYYADNGQIYQSFGHQTNQSHHMGSDYSQSFYENANLFSQYSQMAYPTAGSYSTMWNQHTQANGTGMANGASGSSINGNGAYGDEFNSQFQQHVPLFESHQTNGYTTTANANPAVANTFIS